MDGGITDYLFTQGVLGFALIVSMTVNVYQQRKSDKKDGRIDELQNLRLEDSREMAEKVTVVLQDTSQNLRVLSEKIEIAKDKRK